MKNYTLCDFSECPLKGNCWRFLADLDRTKVVHFAVMPYKKDKCNFFEPLTEDDLIERVQRVINKLNDNHKN